MKILFCEVRHFSPNFQVYTQFCLCIFLLVRKQYLPKKNSTFLAQKFLIFFLSKSVLGYYKTKKKRKKSGMDH